MSSSRNQLHVKNTKELILEKSLEIIVSEGIHALTMRRLAKDIGMSAPNLYNYYVNKEQIYLTLMLKGFQSLSSMLEASVSSSSCPKERAERFMRSYVEFGLTNPSYYDVMFSSSNPKFNGYIGTVHELLSSEEQDLSMSLAVISLKLIDEYGRSKKIQFSAEKTKEIMTSFWAFLHGLVCLYNSQNIFYVVDNAEELYSLAISNFINQLDRIYGN